MIEAILESFGAFVLFLFFHVLVFYYRKPQERWRVVERICFLCLCIYTAVFWLAPASNWFGVLNLASPYAKVAAYINGVGIYIFLFFSYAQFYFLIDRSISARILVEFERSSSKTLTWEEIQQRYDAALLQKRRLDDMVYGGYLIYENDVYRMTKKGALHAKVFDRGKRLLRMYPGG